MATTLLGETVVNTVGDLPVSGTSLPSFTLTVPGLTEISEADVAGKRVILNIFPSVDTGICAMSVRTFNELAAGLDNTTVICVSHDLPFALARFCGAEGIDNVLVASGFRSDFGEDFGLTMADGGMRGLLARAVIVADSDGIISHVELVPAIRQEPDYQAALAALA